MKSYVVRTACISICYLFSFSVFSQLDWNRPFEDCGVRGSITIYDYQQKKWLTNDIDDSQYATLPASTFKIVNTLIALETGVVENDNEVIPWIDDYDTSKYGHRPNIYRSMSLKEAFKLSAGWAYVELAKRIGKQRYKKILTEIGYGNVNLSIDDPDFWNFGSFAISPVNQIQVLVNIYEETVPFSVGYIKILKDMMVEKRTNITRLIKDRSEDNPDFGSCRKEITMEVFRELGVVE